MHLNTLAGRTYNDYMQYPMLPWVLADYTSEVSLLAVSPATLTPRAPVVSMLSLCHAHAPWQPLEFSQAPPH